MVCPAPIWPTTITNGDPQPTNAGLPAHHVGLLGNALEDFHGVPLP
jgi:hypothetical protein